MAKKQIREYRKMFEAFGVEFEEKQTNGGHVQYTVVHAGKKQKFTFASTPSDKRAMMNNRAEVMRFLRKAETE